MRTPTSRGLQRREIPFHLSLTAITYGAGKAKGREATAGEAGGKAVEHAGYITRASARGDIICQHLGTPYDGQVVDGTQLGEREIGVILAAARQHIARRVEAGGKKEGRIVDKLEVAIPRELSHAQEIEVIQQLIRDATGGGRAAALAVRHIDHAPDPRQPETEEGIEGNLHWHIDIYDVGETKEQAMERVLAEGGKRVRQRLGVAQLGDLIRDGVLDPPDTDHPDGRAVKTKEWLRRCYHAHVWAQFDRLGLRDQVIFDYRSYLRRHEEDGEPLRAATTHEGAEARRMAAAGKLRPTDLRAEKMAENGQIRLANRLAEEERVKQEEIRGKAKGLQGFARRQAGRIKDLESELDASSARNRQLRSVLADTLAPAVYDAAELGRAIEMLDTDPVEARRLITDGHQRILAEIRGAKDSRSDEDLSAARARAIQLAEDLRLTRIARDSYKRSLGTRNNELFAARDQLKAATQRADQAEADRDIDRRQIGEVEMVIAPWEVRLPKRSSDTLADRVRGVINLIRGDADETRRSALAEGYAAGEAAALERAEPSIVERIKRATDRLIQQVNDLSRQLAEAITGRDLAVQRAEAAERERDEFRRQLEAANASSPEALAKLLRDYGGVMRLVLSGELHLRDRDVLPGLDRETWDRLHALSRQVYQRERGSLDGPRAKQQVHVRH